MWTQTELWRWQQDRERPRILGDEALVAHIDDLAGPPCHDLGLVSSGLNGHPCRRLGRPPRLTELEPDDLA